MLLRYNNMKLIKPSFEILEQAPELKGLLSHIELCGRVCYKSEDKITENSGKAFVERLIASRHLSVLEHGTIYLDIPYEYRKGYSYYDHRKQYELNQYSILNVTIKEETLCPTLHVTTNYRVLVENDWLDDLKYLCLPTEHHEKRISVKFICDRGILAEFTRHRVFSFAAESTRYCNYSKDKFGNELTFIIPNWIDNVSEGSRYNYDDDIDSWQKSEDANTSNFLQSLAWSEKNYLTLLGNGWTPQQARGVLPNALKTELIMTGTVSQWKDFFKLRCANSAHPQARELATSLQSSLKYQLYLREYGTYTQENKF